MQDVLTPVLVAAATTLIGLVGAWFGARALQRLGLGDSQLQVNRSLRELAETWEAKYTIEVEAHERDKDEWAKERSTLTLERDHYRREADDCDRRLNNAYAEMRATGRLTDRRAIPRGKEVDNGV